MLQRTSVSQLGTNLFLLFPVEWTLGSGLRLGLDAGLGWNVDGVDYSCMDEYCDSYSEHDWTNAWLLGVRAGFGERSGTVRESGGSTEHRPLAVLSLDLMLGLLGGGKTWTTYTTGAQVGTVLPYHIRAALRAERPGPDTSDTRNDVGLPPPKVALTGALGYAVVDRPSVVLAPSVGFSMTNERMFGYMAQLLLPATYRTQSGLEFGAEAGVGKALGGSKWADPCTIPGGSCGLDQPPVKLDVRADWAGSFGLYVGYGIPVGA